MQKFCQTDCIPFLAHFHRVCGPFLFQRRLLSSSFFSSSTCFLVEILLSLMLTSSRSVLFSLVVVVWLPPLFTCWKAVACFLARPFPQPQETTPCQKRRWRGRGLFNKNKKLNPKYSLKIHQQKFKDDATPRFVLFN